MSKGICAIITWRVHEGQEEEFKRRWEADSNIFQSYPGARGTKLHQSTEDPRIFMAYACWDSMEQRSEAEERMWKEYERELEAVDTDAVSEFLSVNFFSAPLIQVNLPR